jgi:hypothetical protein
MRSALIILSLLITSIGFAQEEDNYVFGDNATESNSVKGKGFDWDRVTIGGGVGLMVGNNNTLIGVSPTFGYYITDNILLGLGAEYTYEKNFYTYTPYYANTYGGKAFGQYFFDNMPLLAHVEVESVTIDVNYAQGYYEDEVINMLNVYVGGGLKQRLGGYSFLYALVLYNLNETPESYYIQTNPIIRIGIAIGL